MTVLFSDVTGSTALGERLDPEALRGVLARYFDMARLAVERHGGSVEKFIGDAVMAVFGIPVVHEDDALRAVRAAAELRDGLAGLNEGLMRDYGTALEVRIGVNTGEVVAGTEERLATGDAVNVAARLEQAARPGEILVGAPTQALVRGSVALEPVEGLELKGKSAPVEAYRLMSVRLEVAPRRRVGAMVGRERELERLRAALAQAVDSRCCQLFTVLGDAGVGKSRLAYEFLAGLDGATVVRAGCPPYGEGITYWPVVEVLKQVLGEEPERRLEALGLDSFSSRAVHAVLGDPGAATSVDEIARATRVLLEAVAAEAPLVIVLDDIQWGEAAFLDLVDHVAELSRDVPMLLLCMARPELYDRRPGWGGGKLNATTVLLEPLVDGDADVLVASLLDDNAADEGLRARILAAAEGNPLFAEEMVALVRDSPGGQVVVPPTIQALLAARLDQLEPTERAVLGRGSIEGRVFHRGAVQALSPDETELTAPLSGLVRRELVRPDRAQLAGEEAFRFRHLLIRDAAYDALPKATRAELHERFASWIGAHGGEVVEHDEVAGYHLEPRIAVASSSGLPAIRPVRWPRVRASIWRQRERRPQRAATCEPPPGCSPAPASSCRPAMPAVSPSCRRSGGRSRKPVSGSAPRRCCRKPWSLRRPQAIAGLRPMPPWRARISGSSPDPRRVTGRRGSCWQRPRTSSRSSGMRPGWRALSVSADRSGSGRASRRQRSTISSELPATPARRAIACRRWTACITC